jgi:hypothetical protein
MRNQTQRTILQEAADERRRFRRVRLPRTGRVFIPETAERAECTLEDISAGGARAICKFKQPPAGYAVIYLDGLGRFEGVITRVSKNRFTITFTCSQEKKQMLIDLLTIELNRHVLESHKPPEPRFHSHIMPLAPLFTRQ